MYAYATGTGCTGDAKLVASGDELIFLSIQEWDQHKGSLLSEVAANSEGTLASTCPAPKPMEPSRPFNQPLQAADLKELSHKNFSAETLKKV